MLSNLLPGIREVRAPFVAGFITLVALYLFLDEEVADLTGPGATDNSIETWARIARVVRWAGRSRNCCLSGWRTHYAGHETDQIQNSLPT